VSPLSCCSRQGIFRGVAWICYVWGVAPAGRVERIPCDPTHENGTPAETAEIYRVCVPARAAAGVSRLCCGAFFPMRPPRVYFYCRNEPGNLQEDVIALAEGFVELGIPFHSSCDYWLQSTKPDDYLLKCNPEVGPDDCNIVIVSYTWPYWIRTRTFDLVRRPLPDGLFKKGIKYVTVYMDNHDGHRTVS